jgi:carbamoyltransferase
MNILGLNGYFNADHDAGAAIVMDGVVVAAVEQERLARRKRAVGLPPGQAVGEVLALAGISARDVDVIAYPWNPVPLGLDAEAEAAVIRGSLCSADTPLRPDVPVRYVDHHTAHAWCGLAYLPPERRADVVVLTLDGSGESTAGAGFRFRNGVLTREWHLSLESSLGIFYEAATAAIGFGWGEEGKTMGLSSYGRPEPIERLPTFPDDRFTGDLPALGADYESLVVKATAEISPLVEGATFMQLADVAAGAQAVLEHRIRSLIADYQPPPPEYVLAGGTALNCVANGKLAAELAAADVGLTVPPPANDSGIAIGAAVAIASELTVPRGSAGAFLGRQFSTAEIAHELPGAVECTTDSLAALLFEQDAAIGWFDGPAEIGPRALGGRCVIARPDSVRVRDRINVSKGRETWRPLAPSVTIAEFNRSFRGEPSPYMLKAATVLPAARPRLAGITHADGSARPQVVPAGTAYAGLLAAVGRASGTEAVICTSFNVAGEPIVYRPREALRSARAMNLDAIAGDGWMLPLRSGLT